MSRIEYFGEENSIAYLKGNFDGVSSCRIKHINKRC